MTTPSDSTTHFEAATITTMSAERSAVVPAAPAGLPPECHTERPPTFACNTQMKAQLKLRRSLEMKLHVVKQQQQELNKSFSSRTKSKDERMRDKAKSSELKKNNDSLKKKIKTLDKSFFQEAILHLRFHLLHEGEGEIYRHKIETNKKKGYYFLKNQLGPSAELMFKEVHAACNKKNNPDFSDIAVSADQVSYTKLFFKNSLSDTSTTFSIMAPVVGILGHNGTFHHLPFLSHFFHQIVFHCIANSKNLPKLQFVKGAILSSHQNILKKNWVEPVLHSDFHAHKSNFPKEMAQPMTFFMALGPNELNLKMGSLTRQPQEAHNKTPQNIVVHPGDAVMFSWRQWHKTGTPVFPTNACYRFHLMLSGKLEDVSDEDSVDIHPAAENDWKRVQDRAEVMLEKKRSRKHSK